MTRHLPRPLPLLAATLLAALLAAALPPPAAASEGKIVGTAGYDIPPWFKDSFLDLEEDAIEAGDEGRHLLVFFHLKDCPYCAKMLEDSFAAGNANAPLIRENFDSVEINIRGAREVAYRGDTLTEKAFSRAIGVQYTPTLLFLEESGQAVLTVSGYRSPAALARALRYVKDKAYRRMTLTEYQQTDAAAAAATPYAPRPHPNLQALTDLSAAAVPGPLLLMLEDDTCDECDWVHDNILSQDDVRAQLKKITAARLDAKSDAMITTPAGERMSMAAFARQLDLSYRPGVVFFDGGREVFRITGLLNHYHFREAVRYVAIGHRAAYPRFGAYLRARRQELLADGQTIDYSI